MANQGKRSQSGSAGSSSDERNQNKDRDRSGQSDPHNIKPGIPQQGGTKPGQGGMNQGGGTTQGDGYKSGSDPGSNRERTTDDRPERGRRETDGD